MLTAAVMRSRGWIAAHSAMATNTLSLYGSTIVTSLLGFAFWWLAAREFSAHQVGSSAAVLSAMQLVATACMLGLNTLLIGELARNARQSRSLIWTATAVVSAVSAAVAIVVCLVLSAANPRYHDLLGNPVAVAVFTIGTVFTAATVVLDDACIGLLQGNVQLHRNTFFSAAKLLFVPVAIVTIPGHHGLGLTLSWVVATVLSVWFLRPLSKLATAGPVFDLRLVRKHAALAVRHHWLNVSLQAPRLVLPVIAVALIGATQTAGYFTAATIVSFFAIIPFHFATVLFALDPGDEPRLTHEVRFTFSISSVVAIGSVPVLWVFASLALRIFGPAYTSATHALIILAVTTLPMAVKYHYVAILRVRSRLTRAAATTMAGSILEVAAAAAGGSRWGITGLAIGILIAQLVEAACFAPAVVSVLRGRGGHGHVIDTPPRILVGPVTRRPASEGN